MANSIQFDFFRSIFFGTSDVDILTVPESYDDVYIWRYPDSFFLDLPGSSELIELRDIDYVEFIDRYDKVDRRFLLGDVEYFVEDFDVGNVYSDAVDLGSFNNLTSNFNNLTSFEIEGYLDDGDRDFYSFTTSEVSDIEISLFNQSGNYAFRMWRDNGEGKPTFGNQWFAYRGQGQDERLFYGSLNPDTYYVEVWAVGDSLPGEYSLAINTIYSGEINWQTAEDLGTISSDFVLEGRAIAHFWTNWYKFTVGEGLETVDISVNSDAGLTGYLVYSSVNGERGDLVTEIAAGNEYFIEVEDAGSGAFYDLSFQAVTSPPPEPEPEPEPQDLVTGGDDVINGTEGDDIIDAGAGNDVIFGSSGNDILSAGEGFDKLYGEAGDDVLIANGGVVNLFGGSGADKFYLNASFPSVRDFNRGEGDKIHLTQGSPSNYSLQVSGGSTNLLYGGQTVAILNGTGYRAGDFVFG